jgi:hypothetical protein
MVGILWCSLEWIGQCLVGSGWWVEGSGWWLEGRGLCNLSRPSTASIELLVWTVASSGVALRVLPLLFSWSVEGKLDTTVGLVEPGIGVPSVGVGLEVIVVIFLSMSNSLLLMETSLSLSVSLLVLRRILQDCSTGNALRPPKNACLETTQLLFLKRTVNLWQWWHSSNTLKTVKIKILK